MAIDVQLQLALPGFDLNVDMHLPERGITTLFGPSGSGKSTLLRCIAGLESAASGRVVIGEQVWQSSEQKIFLPTHQRALGFVFQDARLFAHLDVRRNLEFGLNRTPIEQRYLPWDDVIELLDIGHLLQRKPGKLSGGEQQRVAIGRALLAGPELLLMDEPLASLDNERKQEVLPFLRRLHEHLQVPVIYVSHSLPEVLQITDTLVLIRQGKIVASGSLQKLSSELNLGVYLGDMAGSVIDTTVVEHDSEFGLTRLTFSGRDIFVPQQDVPLGSMHRVHILARNVGVALQPPEHATSFLNILQAVVLEIAEVDPQAHTVQLKLDVGVPLLASISRKSLHVLQLQPGKQCYAMIKAVSLASASY